MSFDPKLRALPTHQLSINLPVTVVGTPETLLLVDLSTLGMKLSGASTPAVGETHEFVIELGVLPTFGIPRLALRGEVRWSAPDSAPGRSLIGVRFESLAPDVHVIVGRIIDRLAL